jgi:uncharacterized membrane protein
MPVTPVCQLGFGQPLPVAVGYTVSEAWEVPVSGLLVLPVLVAPTVQPVISPVLVLVTAFPTTHPLEPPLPPTTANRFSR